MGGSGVPIGLSNSETGVTYQLMIGSPPGSPVGPQLNGTGGPINFGLHTTAGTYTVIATKTPPGCSITMNGNAMILVNPLPAAPTGIVYHANCLHPTTGAIDFNNLPIGNWTLNWIFNPGNIPGSTTGNGSSFALLGLAAPGTYTFTVIEPISGCSSGSSSFTINAPPPIPPEPITLDVTQPTCTVPTGTITVLGPLGGVQYQLDSGPFQPVGVVTFNGIIPGNHSITGRLTADTTCFLNSVNVMIAGVTIPAAPSVASPITYCVGATAVPLTATVTGTNTLLWYTTATGGTGSAIAPTPSTATAGTTSYWVSQVSSAPPNCESLRSKIDVVVVALPAAPVVTSTVNYCVGATAVALTATVTGTNTLLWYTTATGGTGSAIAPTPSTATAGTTSYWVSQVSSAPPNCESLRSKIDVIVVALPAAPAVISPVNYCIGTTAVALTATVTGTNTLLWYTTATGGTGSNSADTINSYSRNNILLGKPGR